jgi:hypothetical protein
MHEFGVTTSVGNEKEFPQSISQFHSVVNIPHFDCDNGF